MSLEQIQGLYICLTITVMIAAVCPLVFFGIRGRSV